MTYRERIYSSYVSGHFGCTHALSRDEFLLFSRVAERRYAAFLPEDRNARILDVACGAGHFAFFLRTRGYKHVTGIDSSQEQLEAAAGIGIPNLVRADLFQYLPEHPGAFDMIAANDIIEHLRKDELFPFLDAIRTALVPGGTFPVSTPNAQSLFGAGGVFVDFTHETGFTPESLLQVLRTAGFRNARAYGEKPIAHDLPSLARAILWAGVRQLLRAFLVMERGTGRGVFRPSLILEPRMFAVCTRDGA